jgi:hypothetical protein
MRRDDAKATEIGVTKLARRLAEEPRLQPEIQRARREFFGQSRGLGPVLPGAADLAEHRFAEWFALERESETLGAVPATIAPFDALADDLDGSTVGVFLVQQAGQNGVFALDLQDEAILELGVPPGSLQQGDLVVGRLFPGAQEQWEPSTACAVFRPGEPIGTAFLRDVKRLDLGRRLQQVELEHLLLHRPDQTASPTAAAAPAIPLEHLEADLEQLLQDAGGKYSAAVISQELARVARAGPVMGPLLDDLAFDTSVDLDRARQLLLQIWNAHHDEADAVAAGPVEADAMVTPAPGESLGELLVRTLDEGLAQKRDLEELFAQLERMAGIEPEPEAADAVDAEAEDGDSGEDDSGEPAPRRADRGDDGDGDLLPLVEEFLWETQAADQPIAAVLRSFVELQQNAPVPRTDLETVLASDLLRLLLHVYLGAGTGQRAKAVQDAFAALQRFYDWAEATHEMPVRAALADCRGGLLDHVARLDAAGAALSTPAAGTPRPGILVVEDVGPQGFGVRDDEGGDHWLVSSVAASANLRVGDLVLGSLQPGAGGRGQQLVGPVVVLPAESKHLME